MNNEIKDWKDISITLATILKQACDRAGSCQEDCCILPCPIHDLKSNNTIKDWIKLAQNENKCL